MRSLPESVLFTGLSPPGGCWPGGGLRGGRRGRSSRLLCGGLDLSRGGLDLSRGGLDLRAGVGGWWSGQTGHEGSVHTDAGRGVQDALGRGQVGALSRHRQDVLGVVRQLRQNHTHLLQESTKVSVRHYENRVQVPYHV